MSMNIDKIVFAFAGIMILISLSFGVFINTNWFYLTAFVGINMVQTSLTGFCPLALLLKKLGFKTGKLFK